MGGLLALAGCTAFVVLKERSMPTSPSGAFGLFTFWIDEDGWRTSGKAVTCCCSDITSGDTILNSVNAAD